MSAGTLLSRLSTPTKVRHIDADMHDIWIIKSGGVIITDSSSIHVRSEWLPIFDACRTVFGGRARAREIPFCNYVGRTMRLTNDQFMLIKLFCDSNGFGSMSLHEFLKKSYVAPARGHTNGQ